MIEISFPFRTDLFPIVIKVFKKKKKNSKKFQKSEKSEFLRKDFTFNFFAYFFSPEDFFFLHYKKCISKKGNKSFILFSFCFFFFLESGLPDEIQNGLIDTYHLHKQDFKLFQETNEKESSENFPLSSSKMIRCVPLKVYAATMSM